MPPAFSLSKCLGSYYLQGIATSFAPASHLPILYQTRTLRIRHYVQPDKRRLTRAAEKGIKRGNLRKGDDFEAKERNSESNDAFPVSANYHTSGEGVDKVSGDGEAQEDYLNPEKKRVQDEQSQHQHQEDPEPESRPRRPPITVPLEPVQSTITPGEQNTFARLFDMAASGKLDAKPRRSSTAPSAATGQGKKAKEQDDEMNYLAESILQRHIPPEDQTLPEMDVTRYPEPLRPIVVGRSAGLWEKQQEEKRIEQMKSAMAGVGLTGPLAASTVGPAVPNSRFADIIKHMSKARTDFDLWGVLRSNVFDDFEKLKKAGLLERQQTTVDTDDDAEKPTNTSTSKAEKKKDKDKKSIASKTGKKDPPKLPNVDIFRTNYPHLLVAAVQQLRRNFPASSLALTVLAETKALGLVSYILGASTALYNESLEIIWSVYSDLGAVNRLLQEMDNGGIDFDGQTLLLLDSIFKDCTNMAGLPEGKMLGVIWRMDKSVREVRQLGEWRDTVRQRLEAEALRRVREQESEADLIAATL